MQTNAMKRALERGETQVGVWINMVRNPAILWLLSGRSVPQGRVLQGMPVRRGCRPLGGRSRCVQGSSQHKPSIYWAGRPTASPFALRSILTP